MAGLRNWVNVERGVFVAAALWLLVTGVRFQNAPVTEHWGPPRVPDAPPDHQPLNLAAPPPIGEFLASERGSPFGDVERRVAYRPPSLGSWRPPTIKPKPTVRVTAKPPAPPPPPPAPPKPKPTEEKPAAKPKPYDLPVRLAGRVEVGGMNGRTIFIVKEDGKYISVKEGEELPGLGVRVVRATKNVVIVENEKGQRFRLNDLLRARGGGGDDGDDGE
jgi:hypothetical protein